MLTSTFQCQFCHFQPPIRAFRKSFSQCGGSGIFIPDPNCLHPESRILIKEFKYFNPQKSKKKWFLSSKKYDPGCSSRISDPDADFFPSRIPDPGVKKTPNPGFRIRIRNTGFSLRGHSRTYPSGGGVCTKVRPLA